MWTVDLHNQGAAMAAACAFLISHTTVSAQDIGSVFTLDNQFVNAGEEAGFAGSVPLERQSIPLSLMTQDRNGEWLELQTFTADGPRTAVIGGPVTTGWSVSQTFGWEAPQYTQRTTRVFGDEDQRVAEINVAVMSEGQILSAPLSVYVYCGQKGQECCYLDDNRCDDGLSCDEAFGECVEAPRSDPPPQTPPQSPPQAQGEWWEVACLCSDTAGKLKSFGAEYCYEGPPNAGAVCNVHITGAVRNLTGDQGIQCIGDGVQALGDGESCRPTTGAVRNVHVR